MQVVDEVDSPVRAGSAADRKLNPKLVAALLERIAQASGPVNPNDRAMAKIYAETLRQEQKRERDEESFH